MVQAMVLVIADGVAQGTPLATVQVTAPGMMHVKNVMMVVRNLLKILQGMLVTICISFGLGFGIHWL